MAMEIAGSVVDPVARILGIVTWPMVVLVIVVLFRSALQKRLEEGGVKVKAGGVELTIERATEAAAALGIAEGTKSDGPVAFTEVARAASNAARSTVGRLDRAAVLWIDDHPENNQFERLALEALQIQFFEARSTSEALQLLAARPYNLLITDLGRSSAEEDDPDAGIHLIDEVRSQGFKLPCIVYSGVRAIQERERILAAGAATSTNDPTELFQAVVEAIVR